MNDVEKLIAKLVDEHKINGEEAIVLIKSAPHKPWKTPNQRKDLNSNLNSITSISDGTTVTYQLCGELSFFI